MTRLPPTMPHAGDRAVERDAPSPRARHRRVATASAAIAAAALAVAGCGGDDAVAEAPTATPKACDAALATLSLTDATVLSADPVAAGDYAVPDSRQTLAGLPAFCRIRAQATPTSVSRVNFEVWVPQAAAWNGKMVVTGNGGYSPALSFGDMGHALRQGYAAVGGDTGHQSADPNAMFWGVEEPERITDWGSRSIHAITGPSREIVAQLTAQPPRRAYYYGCSTGGHQAYAEMQRHPGDFDGVIAGAPGNNRTRLNVEFLWRFQANRARGTSGPLILPAAKAALITQSAIAACDSLDGVSDGVMEDPRACTSARFDVASLTCTGAETATCLTPEQVTVARKIYAGPVNPRTGVQLYPGLPVGTESGWPAYWGGTEPVRADYWRLWVFGNPQWDVWSFDYDRDVAFADAKLAARVDQTSADLSAFKARGGKAIVYQGWQDPVVNAIDTIAYVDRVRAMQGAPAATDDFLRLFLVPGMGHCSGGAGATVFGNAGTSAPGADADSDLLRALDRWVEQGTAPDRLVASRIVGGTVTRTRALCPYPKKAVHDGGGSVDAAASYRCE